MSPAWDRIVRELHAALVKIGPETDPALLREKGLSLDPLGDFRFRRTAEEVLASGLATGCDDYAKAFLHRARAAGLDALLVWAASERELAAQDPGQPLCTEGRILVLAPANPARLVSGHQFAAVREGSRWSLVDPSQEGQHAVPAEDPPESLVGTVLAWPSLAASWPRWAERLRARGCEGDGLSVRRVGRDDEAGNSAERLMKIYASGDPEAPTLAYRPHPEN